jgi:hypothetical protein
MVAGVPMELLQRKTAVWYGSVPDALGVTLLGSEQFALMGDEFLPLTALLLLAQGPQAAVEIVRWGKLARVTGRSLHKRAVSGGQSP